MHRSSDRRMQRRATPVVLTLLLALAPAVAAAEEPSLEARLERLCEELERARVEAHVPGLSIAVVKDGHVVLARGLGLADVEAGRAADAETLYAVGSTTKAFTATLVAMLVDEGRLTWDDPVSRWLPYYEPHVRSSDPEARCTLRDLLSHRHGFSRMGLLWFGGRISRETILRTAAGAEPWDDFRKGFHYCNVGYLAAGEAAGAAAGTSWDELMEERLLEPLGMTASTVRSAAALEDARLARGYSWNDADGRAEPQRFVPLDPIGPAGSLTSNVLDMAQWVRLQLGHGEVDDLRLVSPEVFEETWSPQISIGGGVDYGMGWMLRRHHGRRVVEHGGNIQGFTAEVALLPDDGLGYVLLMNLGIAPLQASSLPIVVDALLEDAPGDGAQAELAAEDYAGTYVAAFATFRDEEFEVRVVDGGLALHIPSQMTFALKPPGEDGRWPFALTDQISVSFERGEDGEVEGLVLHQSGFDFEAPRKGREPEPDATPEELARYLGTYGDPEGDREVRVLLSHGRLAFDDGESLLPLVAPDGEGWAPLRANDRLGATFRSDDDGRVEALEFQGTGGSRTFVRKADPAAAELPTVDEVLALRRVDERRAARAEAGGVRVTGEVDVPQAGLRGRLTIEWRGPDYANRMDFGEFGHVDTGMAGGEAWADDSLRGVRTLHGAEEVQARLSHPDVVDGDWREWFDDIQVLRTDDLDGRPVVVVSLAAEGLPARTFWVDAERGDVLRREGLYAEESLRVPVTTTFSDFVEVAGVRRARRVEIENPQSGSMVLTFSDVETGLELGDERFRPAAPEADAAGR